MEINNNNEIAKFWGVSVRTVQRWYGEEMQPHSIEWMRQYALTHKVSASVKEKLNSAAADSPTSRLGDEELEKFISEMEVEDNPKGEVETQLQFLGYYKKRVTEALVKGNKDDLKFYMDLFNRTAESLRKARLLADRLGLDMGDTISRTNVEEWLVCFMWWMLRCIDTSITDLSRRCTGKDFPEEIAAILEPSLVSAVFVLPIEKSGDPGSGMDLPPWFREAVTRGVMEFLEEDKEADVEA